jgi:hypothetical protein
MFIAFSINKYPHLLHVSNHVKEHFRESYPQVAQNFSRKKPQVEHYFNWCFVKGLSRMVSPLTSELRPVIQTRSLNRGGALYALQTALQLV